MKKMWKVVRECELGLIGEDACYTFEEAKIRFRNVIKAKLGEELQNLPGKSTGIVGMLKDADKKD